MSSSSRTARQENSDLSRIVSDRHFDRVMGLLKDHGGKVRDGGRAVVRRLQRRRERLCCVCGFTGLNPNDFATMGLANRRLVL